MSGGDTIRITGAREHNLRNVSVRIPRGKLTVITGLSGSGKSSLAFDTLYAEGQRRYVESLSAYARRFLDQLPKPRVKSIEGLSPAIAIEQRTAGSNPRSIVATTTEIHDYLRLFFSAVGHPHCPDCGRPIRRHSAEQIVDRLLALPRGTRLVLLAPYRVSGRRSGASFLKEVRRRGFTRVRIGDTLYDLDEKPAVPTDARLAVAVDRLVLGPDLRSRLTDSVELTLREGRGVLLADIVLPAGDRREERFSERLDCPNCDRQFDPAVPAHFSFNNPRGACPACHGLGRAEVFREDRVVPDQTLPLEKAVAPWQRGGRRLILNYRRQVRALCKAYSVDPKTPYNELPDGFKKRFLEGTGNKKIETGAWRGAAWHRRKAPFEGVLPNLARRLRETKSPYIRDMLRRYTTRQLCSVCQGARLRPERLACTIGGRSIADVTALSVRNAQAFMADPGLSEEETRRVRDVVQEVQARLSFLSDVGLDYLTLDRASGTLSGGESQRIRLATQLGAKLAGVLYVLDEPTIGLHALDTDRLVRALRLLRDRGNTVVVVEHDAKMIRAADFVIDLGPGAGRAGGRVVYAGNQAGLLRSGESITAAYLRGERSGAGLPRRLPPGPETLVVEKARGHNLKGITVRFPLGRLVCVTGVSGSGKSTLVNDTLRRAVARTLSGAREEPEPYRALRGSEAFSRMIVVDDAPIGRTPRSNPATYTEVFPWIRNLFARVPLARARGYRPGRFSFNVKGGRCEHCKGAGLLRIDMQFLPDVYVTCEACGGRRYNRETLEIRYRGLTISEVLELTVAEALEFFTRVPRLKQKLSMLNEVGLGYVRLGQSATTLSGGEAQRMKLAAELGRRAPGHTLYLLDEPTTGLHFADVEQLVAVLKKLRDLGHTVLVIEHNLELIRHADWVVDLGPEGGDAGGRLVAEGTPEQLMECPPSATGQALKRAEDEARKR